MCDSRFARLSCLAALLTLLPCIGAVAHAQQNTAYGDYALANNTYGSYNAAFGMYALTWNTTGDANTASGIYALPNNSTGYYNTASGFGALWNNTTGSQNTASGMYALSSNDTGTNNTAIGYYANVSAGNLTNATAIGAWSVVSQSNSLVLGGTGTAAVKVGIGTAKPSNVFTIGRGSGRAIADGWSVYSSRRWKANIHTLEGALGKVGRLRGVSYDVEATGKREVGVIAEEVGAIVPEVVTWEENGKDAQGVDYSRLTALLIEATKEQQALIQKQQAQIDQLILQVKSIQRTSFGTNSEAGTGPRVAKAEIHQ